MTAKNKERSVFLGFWLSGLLFLWYGYKTGLYTAVVAGSIIVFMLPPFLLLAKYEDKIKHWLNTDD